MANSVCNLTLEEAHNLDKENPIVIDVRTDKEIEETGTIYGSLHLQWDMEKNDFVNIDQKNLPLPIRRDKTVIVYCRSGRRASQAREKLIEGFGFQNVYNATNMDCVRSSALTGGRPRIHMRQLFDSDSCTYTYILSDLTSKQAIIIDPVIEHAERDVDVLKSMGVDLQYILNTHVHADHITGSAKLRQMLSANEGGSQKTLPKTVISKASGAVADKHICDGDTIEFGSRYVYARHTPGHTPGCMTYVLDDLSIAFTGDALLIGGCGRTDFQGGDPSMLYDSVVSKILSLPLNCLLYPGHDYKGRTVTTVEEEKAGNPRLTLNKEDFVKLMNKKFDGSNYPRKLDASLPANMVCGVFEGGEFDTSQKPVAHPDGFVWVPQNDA